MKKRLLIGLIGCMLAFSLVGCGNDTYDNAKKGGVTDDDWGDGYFTIVESWGGVGVHRFMIVYANDTKVMYFIDANSIAGGMTPLYNTDGTIKVYDGD